MHGGYLIIETDDAHPGLVHVLETASLPPEDRRAGGHGTGPRIRYIARFDDLSAGRMHVHGALRRNLLDVEQGLYRCDPIAAVAAAEASELTHRTAYLDPQLAEDPRLEATLAERRERRRLADRIWQAVGISAVLLLVIKLLLGF